MSSLSQGLSFHAKNKGWFLESVAHRSERGRVVSVREGCRGWLPVGDNSEFGETHRPAARRGDDNREEGAIARAWDLRVVLKGCGSSRRLWGSTIPFKERATGDSRRTSELTNTQNKETDRRGKEGSTTASGVTRCRSRRENYLQSP